MYLEFLHGGKVGDECVGTRAVGEEFDLWK